MLCPRYGRPQGAEDCPLCQSGCRCQSWWPRPEPPWTTYLCAPLSPRTLQLKPQGIKISKLYTVLEHWITANRDRLTSVLWRTAAYVWDLALWIRETVTPTLHTAKFDNKDSDYLCFTLDLAKESQWKWPIDHFYIWVTNRDSWDIKWLLYVIIFKIPHILIRNK